MTAEASPDAHASRLTSCSPPAARAAALRAASRLLLAAQAQLLMPIAAQVCRRWMWLRSSPSRAIAAPIGELLRQQILREQLADLRRRPREPQRHELAA